MEQKPSIGRIVHYTNLGDKDGKYPPTVQGAMITAVNDDGTVALKVFYKTGLFDCDNIPFSEEPMKRGHWNWPPRVGEEVESIEDVPWKALHKQDLAKLMDLEARHERLRKAAEEAEKTCQSVSARAALRAALEEGK